jgi:hypothetical protein
MLPRGKWLGAGICALVYALPFAAAAQSLGTTGPFSVTVSPQYPAPYSTASLSFVSGSLDLANATLTVKADGKQIYTGNAAPVSVPLSAAGKTVHIIVSAASAGGTQTQSLSITPQDVSLVAEPVASVPALYPGKPAVPLEGATRIVAVADIRTPNAAQIDPAALSYTWTVDGAQLASASGIGKDAIVVASPLEYRARDVSVSITSQDGAYVGGAGLTLSPTRPTLRVYESDPLLGIMFDHALSGTYAITGSETSLYAAPFSFPISGGAPAIQWFLNGSSAESGPTVTLRPSGSGTGSAGVSATASAGTYSQAAASLTLTFGSSSGGNLFGL